METQEEFIEKYEVYGRRRVCYERIFHQTYGRHWWEWLLGPKEVPDISEPEMIEEDEGIYEDEIKFRIANNIGETRENVMRVLDGKTFFNLENCDSNLVINALEKARLYAHRLRKTVAGKGIKKADKEYVKSGLASDMTDEIDGYYTNILLPIIGSELAVSKIVRSQLRDMNVFFKEYYLKALIKDILKIVLRERDTVNIEMLMRSEMWKAVDPKFYGFVLAEEVEEAGEDKEFTKALEERMAEIELSVSKNYKNDIAFIRGAIETGLCSAEELMRNPRFKIHVGICLKDAVQFGFKEELFRCNSLHRFIEGYDDLYGLFLDNAGYGKIDLVDFCVELCKADCEEE